MVNEPQSLNTGPGRWRSTLTLSTGSGTSVGLSRRMAPASKLGPFPMNRVFGAPFQGVGKKPLGRRLSAYATKSLTLVAADAGGPATMLAAPRNDTSSRLNARPRTRLPRTPDFGPPERPLDFDIPPWNIRISPFSRSDPSSHLPHFQTTVS